jgi:hypothetical protein
MGLLRIQAEAVATQAASWLKIIGLYLNVCFVILLLIGRFGGWRFKIVCSRFRQRITEVEDRLTSRRLVHENNDLSVFLYLAIPESKLIASKF